MHGLKVIKQQLVFEITRIKHSISIKLKPIIKITNVKENETIITPLHYAPTENRATKIDDSELSYIHRMIDKITMDS
jgi:TATA-binding protein-associated factor Taf7